MLSSLQTRKCLFTFEIHSVSTLWDVLSKPAEEIHVDSCGKAETLRPRRERSVRTRRLSAEPAESEVYFRKRYLAHCEFSLRRIMGQLFSKNNKEYEHSRYLLFFACHDEKFVICSIGKRITMYSPTTMIANPTSTIGCNMRIPWRTHSVIC